MNEIRSASETTAQVEVLIDGQSMGIFPTNKMAQRFIDNFVSKSSNSDIITNESSGVSQKNDEPPIKKRRGRPKKADTYDRASTL
jgi:hypothetical protein